MNRGLRRCWKAPWAESCREKWKSLIFCVQTGIGVGIVAFVLGRYVERKKWTDKLEKDKKEDHAESTTRVNRA